MASIHVFIMQQWGVCQIIGATVYNAECTGFEARQFQFLDVFFLSTQQQKDTWRNVKTSNWSFNLLHNAANECSRQQLESFTQQEKSTFNQTTSLKPTFLEKILSPISSSAILKLRMPLINFKKNLFNTRLITCC